MERQCPAKKGDYTGCPDCGAVIYPDRVREGFRLRCPRCGAVLRNAVKNSINRTLAFSFSGLMLFIPAVFLPVMELNILGLKGESTMLKGVVQMSANGFWWMSFLILAFSVLVPLAIFLLLTFITLSAKAGFYTAWLKKALRLYGYIREWTMPDVYMLSILIAYIKLRDYGNIMACTGLYCYAGAFLMTILASVSFDPRAVWEQFTLPGSCRKPSEGNVEGILCTTCGLFCFDETEGKTCPRCSSRLHKRKLSSVSRTWAFSLTGLFLLIPANVCPITYIVYYGFGEPDTILSGIGCLIRDGMLPIAVVVFIASIIVPIVKLLGMAFLLSALHFRWRINTYQCTVMYRIISVIGRWSMLDLFMLSILVAIVEMGAVSSVDPGIGATAFATVVVMTMLAAMAFDPRMLWDMEENR